MANSLFDQTLNDISNTVREIGQRLDPEKRVRQYIRHIRSTERTDERSGIPRPHNPQHTAPAAGPPSITSRTAALNPARQSPADCPPWFLLLPRRPPVS